jgi:hypothetical protein
MYVSWRLDLKLVKYRVWEEVPTSTASDPAETTILPSDPAETTYTRGRRQA